jgi:hypothetical protein
MSINKLLTPEFTLDGRQMPDTQIDNDTFNQHYEVILQAYEDAGIDPANQDQLCPGLVEGDISFQANVAMAPSGTKLGTHCLIANPDNTHVNELDIFGFKGVFEASSGRLKDPGSRYIRDYYITPSNLAVITSFILEKCGTGQFRPVEEARVLTLPQ